MAHPTALVATLKNAMGSPISSVSLPTGRLRASIDLALAQACGQGLAPHGLDFNWLSSTGELVFWCSLADIDYALLGKSPEALGRSAREGAYRMEAIASLRLMPDYGGASVWTPGGACGALSVDDYLPHAQDARLMEDFEIAIDRWQSHFEFFCDSSAPPGEARFAWAAFSSKAAALALRSRALLAAPLHVEAPWENEQALVEGEASQIWLPEWEDQDALARVASCALERLDEAGFLRAWGQGARQDPSAPMPWAIYGAHLRLARASAAALGQGVRECAWGCSIFEAAMFELCPRALALALVHAPLPREPKGEHWCQVLVSRRHRASLGDSAECLRLLVQAGAPLPSAEWMAAQRPGEHLSALAAQIESAALGSCIASVGPQARTRTL